MRKSLLAALAAFMISTQLASATPQVAAQATASAATLTATVTAVSPEYWYISGFEATCGGATVGAAVQGTVTGLLGGTVDFVVSTGASVGGPAVIVTFPTPIPNATAATNVVLSFATLGSSSICAATIFGELR